MIATASPPVALDAIAEAARASWRGDTAVTPKGAAVAALYHLVRALPQLGADDRAEVMSLVAAELVSVAGLGLDAAGVETLLVIDPRCGAVSVAEGSGDCPTCRPSGTV
jgi:hypothetical protein